MLQAAPVLVCDNRRMNKQPISVTLSPDNLLWLRGRARAEQLGSLSEFLDRLITRARFGGGAPRAARSMKGALAGPAVEPPDDEAVITAGEWQAWQARWDDLLAGLDTAESGRARSARTGASAPAAVVKPVASGRPRRA